MPPPARFFFNTVVASASFFLLISAHLVTFGRTDFRRPADAAVILGAKVYDDGSLSRALKDRLVTGIELYRQGLVSYLVMSGGTGKNGLSEPRQMPPTLQRWEGCRPNESCWTKMGSTPPNQLVTAAALRGSMVSRRTLR